jgi:hypothetical protein
MGVRFRTSTRSVTFSFIMGQWRPSVNTVMTLRVQQTNVECRTWAYDLGHVPSLLLSRKGRDNRNNHIVHQMCFTLPYNCRSKHYSYRSDDAWELRIRARRASSKIPAHYFSSFLCSSLRDVYIFSQIFPVTNFKKSYYWFRYDSFINFIRILFYAFHFFVTLSRLEKIATKV